MNTKHRIKTIMPLAAVAAVFALAPTAQAALSISNPSFESPDLAGAFPSAKQPTDWTVDLGGKGGNAIEIEPRWSQAGGDSKAGPTDGDQVVYFDKRPGSYTSSMEQSVGTVADVGAPLFNLTFDARFGAYDLEADTEVASTNFVAYILVNGVELATWTSTLGAYNAGAGPRLIPNITELGSPVNPAPGASADLMGHFGLDLDVSALDPTHDVVVGFRYESNSNDANYSARVYVDNVAVQGISGPSTLAITSITSVAPPGTWELTLEGEASTGYEFRSSTILDFDPGALVTGLTATVGDISGDSDEFVTTDGDGDATVRMALSGDPADFVRAQTPPPVTLFDEDFEDQNTLPLLGWETGANNPADTATTTWDLGTPSSVGPVPPGVPLPSASNCVGTNIAIDYGLETDIWLRTPSIDLTGRTEATLTFQQWTEIEVFDNGSIQDWDYGSIRILDASDDSVLAVMEDGTIDGNTTGWEEYSMALPAEAFTAAEGTIKIEFRFESDEVENLAGWYIDDVFVTAPGS